MSYTEEQYAEMEAALAERNRRLQADAQAREAVRLAQENEALAPLRAWLASDHVKQVSSEFRDMLPDVRDIARVSVFAFDFIGGLDAAAGRVPVTAPAAAQA